MNSSRSSWNKCVGYAWVLARKKRALQFVKTKVTHAIADGATCVVGGNALASLGPNLFEPAVLTNVSKNSAVWKPESLVPVAPIVAFDSEEEALALANDSSVGLASFFCSQYLSRPGESMLKTREKILH